MREVSSGPLAIISVGDSYYRSLAGVVGDDDVSKALVAPISLRKFTTNPSFYIVMKDGAFVRLMAVALFLEEKRTP